MSFSTLEICEKNTAQKGNNYTEMIRMKPISCSSRNTVLRAADLFAYLKNNRHIRTVTCKHTQGPNSGV